MTEEDETNLKIYCMELLSNIGKRGDIEVELIGHSNKIDKQMEFLLKVYKLQFCFLLFFG